MGFIDDLKKKLATPGAEEFVKARFRAQRPTVALDAGATPPPSAPPPVFFDAEEAARRRRKRLVWVLLLAGAAALVAGGSYVSVQWYREVRTVQKHHVLLSVSGPDRAVAGEAVVLKLRVENGSWVPWENVVLTVQPPESFHLKTAQPTPASSPSVGAAGAVASVAPMVWDLGTVPPRASQDFTVTGQIFGEQGMTALFTAHAKLTPGNRPGTTVENEVFTPISITEIPVDLSIDVPQSAASGTPITIRVVYRNRTELDLTSAELRLEAPEGFAPQTITPPIIGRELIWILPAVPPQGEGEVSVVGVIKGEPDLPKPFRASVGFRTPDGTFLAQRSVQRSLTISRSALSLTQMMNKERDTLKADPGTEVHGSVQFKNTGTRGLREVIIRLSVEGTGMDERSIRVEGGSYDGRSKTITWSPASSPQLRTLRPQESGDVAYLFQLLPVSELPLTTEPAGHYAVTARAVADSPDLPTPPGAPKEIVADQFQLLVNTVPTLRLGAFYDDGRAGLTPSTGPLPPQVGQETVLTVSVRIGNTSNEVTDGTYHTTLPESVQWVGKEYHTLGDVRFNERTREITWTVPLLAARAGIALPEPEFAYQVAITPSLNQVGQDVALTRGHLFEGTDAFTVARVRAETEGVTTELVDPKRSEVVR